ncbi:CPBP family intramembrane glutamic endopeptidase [Pseudobacteriovorax antillogorgiicola]|uniref:Membrane protease YdiL, CAAX protease family n=1 Tax=Pseudobacteriovorax antillogorgiicola TaxID=1513793 RepID=A0A1Y6BP26_9BACT|nr:CPBP family intramembrane glutamic endopeptidase [Pseudobacteriovorax antillogorgiicola]TCS53808.1 membrane protease YdiL (CAAX protease family) [Pseudobacteriovorax antillogorgiicola]SMF22048.1 Membrane protease YdiL, CAAX protease family [Pseudobacteriovorax antillogorgiicola]
MEHKESPEESFNQAQLLKNSSMFYLCIGAVGLMVSYFHHDNMARSWALSSPDYANWEVISLGLLTAGVLAVMAYLFEDFFPSYRALKRVMVGLMGRMTWPGAIYLALLSAVSEEILFRTAIQPSAGVVLTAALFAVLHLGPAQQFGVWALIAFLSGLVFGWTYEATGLILPSLIGHILVNLISFWRFRISFQKAKKRAEKKEGLSPDAPRGVK